MSLSRFNRYALLSLGLAVAGGTIIVSTRKPQRPQPLESQPACQLLPDGQLKVHTFVSPADGVLIVVDETGTPKSFKGVSILLVRKKRPLVVPVDSQNLIGDGSSDAQTTTESAAASLARKMIIDCDKKFTPS